MELFRDTLTFQRLRCVKYLSDASHFTTTLVLRTTLSTGTNKRKKKRCRSRGKTSRTEGVSDSQSFRFAQSALSTPLSFFSAPFITHSPSLSIRLFIAVWPRPLSYTPPQSKRPIRVLISAHGVSRLKKKNPFLEG